VSKIKTYPNGAPNSDSFKGRLLVIFTNIRLDRKPSPLINKLECLWMTNHDSLV
jgi:hypothetical protein